MTSSHANCTHTATKAARAACRRAVAKALVSAPAIENVSPTKIEKGDMLLTMKGPVEVLAVGYANDLHRCGWKFTMAQGDPREYGFAADRVWRLVRAA